MKTEIKPIEITQNSDVYVIFKRLGYSKSQFIIKLVNDILYVEFTVKEMDITGIKQIIDNFLNGNNLSNFNIYYYAPPQLYNKISERLLVGDKSVLELFENIGIKIVCTGGNNAY